MLSKGYSLDEIASYVHSVRELIFKKHQKIYSTKFYIYGVWSKQFIKYFNEIWFFTNFQYIIAMKLSEPMVIFVIGDWKPNIQIVSLTADIKFCKIHLNQPV